MAGTGRSQMVHQFSQVPKAEIQRASFDRSSAHKTTFDSGYLVPIYVDEALPGDTFSMKVNTFARLATPLSPYMDNAYMDFFWFFVPERLVWDNWERFNGAQDNPDDTTDYVMPTITSTASTGYAANSIFDYFGLPVGKPGIVHRADFLRAYNLIWNEWFRDENLQDSVAVSKGDGPDLPTAYSVLRRGKRHDYFTSCLPWPQKGPSVELPLSGNAPIVGIGSHDSYSWSTGPTTVRETSGSTASYAPFGGTEGNTAFAIAGKTSGGHTYPQIFADLSDVAAATINELRQAFQIQRLYERDARGGTRYTEIIRAHFGVVSPDARLQRPEYLGGGECPINITPVVQTSGTGISSQDTPQGNLAAFGTAVGRNLGFSKSFTEHGMIIGLVSVRADLSYQQGLDRMWSRSTRFDFYWPALAHIGEQAVLNQEIFAQGTGHTATDAAAFGYQERYAEYRYKPSKITGEFRSSFAQTLDSWHLAQNFSALPVLNDSFIQDDPPFDRVVADQTDPQFLFDAFFQLRCARPMPLYGVPGLIDHF